MLTTTLRRFVVFLVALSTVLYGSYMMGSFPQSEVCKALAHEISGGKGSALPSTGSCDNIDDAVLNAIYAFSSSQSRASLRGASP